MAQKTLLDIVQGIMSDMDSDNVNKVDDTEESEQVARMILGIYEDMATELDLPPNRKLLELAGATSTTRATEVVLDDRVVELGWVKYNHAATGVANDFQEIFYQTPEMFTLTMQGLDQTLSTVSTYATATADLGGVDIYFKNDKDPTAYTTFDDRILIFDSVDIAVDTSGLAASKLMAYGALHAALALADATVFPIGRQLMSRLVNDSREMAFDLWKEGAPPSVRRKRVRSETRVQRAKGLLSIARQDGVSRPDYGRKTSGKNIAGKGGITSNTFKSL